VTRARMVDVSGKPEVKRVAVARGRLLLKPETVEAIRSRRVEKGDVEATAAAAALLAIKRTPELLPHCHPIPLTGAEVSFDYGPDYVEVEVRVETTYKTGVEMEALTGASIALLTVWDMVKKLEKDELGQYPATRITELRVVSKVKGSPEEGV